MTDKEAAERLAKNEELYCRVLGLVSRTDSDLARGRYVEAAEGLRVMYDAVFRAPGELPRPAFGDKPAADLTDAELAAAGAEVLQLMAGRVDDEVWVALHLGGMMALWSEAMRRSTDAARNRTEELRHDLAHAVMSLEDGDRDYSGLRTALDILEKFRV